MHPFALKTQCTHWKNNRFLETRGLKKLSDEVKQKIYNEDLKNAIITADRRNGRDAVRMRKLFYMQRYSNNEDDKSEESISKPGIHFIQTTRRVLTCTNKALQQKLNGKLELDVSIGSVVALKPFYMTYN